MTTPATASPGARAADTPTLTVEIWSDIACPWCYIGKRRFAAALAAFPHRNRVAVTWRAYELSPGEDPQPGTSELDALARRKGLSTAQVQQMFDHVTAVAAGEGLAYDFGRTVHVATGRLHRLVHVATGLGVADAVLEALYAAHFEDGVDLALEDEVVRVVREAGVPGLDDDAVRAALASPEAAAAVAADQAEARALGVTGVPFFVVDRSLGVSGAQPVEVFSQLLEQGWAAANPLTMLPAVGSGDEGCEDGSCAV